MSELAPVIAPEDRTLFDLHHEDEMTERRFHARQTEYFSDALTALFPDCFVARNMGIYWVPGQRQGPSAGPDVFLSRLGPTAENPSVYLTYEDGPIAFVIEVASEKTRANEPKKRDDTYGAILQIPEYLYVDWERDVLGLWRWLDGAYRQIPPDEQGRFWSQELGVGFAWQDDGRLVRVLTADGTLVPTDQEARLRQMDAEMRAQQEARRAGREARRADREAERAEQEAARATQEAARATQAAARAEQEAARATQEAARAAQEAARAEQEAARAEQEAARRIEAEERAAALAAEFERLRAERDGGRGDGETG